MSNNYKLIIQHKLKRKKILIFFSLFFLILFPIASSASSIIKPHPMFYDAVLFRKAVQSAKSIKPQKNIKAVIVPHHLLAGEITAQMLKTASGRKISTIVVIGPNHENVGGRIVMPAGVDYETSFGKVEPDKSLALRLNRYLKQKENADAFKSEHSIGAIAPFVKYYFPRAKILPIILSSNAGEKEAQKLAGWLGKNIPKDSLVVLSADFSHYLDRTRAAMNDKITEDQIKTANIEKIVKLNNDYVDTPGGLATIALYARMAGFIPEIARHNFSEDFSRNKTDLTTSYFGILYK
jgi:MEMO1 family protein